MKKAIIRMASEKVAEVLIYDTIGGGFFSEGITSKDFRKELKAIKAETINLRINSPGGDVFEAAAMFAALNEHPARIEVDVDGLAASCASWLAMTGDEVRVSSNGMMMIHDPYGGVMGGANDMRRMADLLEKSKGQILDAYARKAKESRDTLSQWMSDETWLTGAEAVEAGLADKVTGEIKIAACVDLAKFNFKHVPPELLARNSAEQQEHNRRKEIAAKLACPAWMEREHPRT